MLANREIISKNREFWRENSECAAARCALKTFRFSFEGGPIAAMSFAARGRGYNRKSDPAPLRRH